ncbi:Calcium-binding EF-hand family protein [Rhynchospora pubera]|uniref:Calcium-binding EF-hand family protein n=1 Tax=Rhynchospora pubera TaxID=906938 RepID=A0AAV8CB58_9POAL|nr:Calcium-binding EF-hand family protein [Rhynchospora pubera]
MSVEILDASTICNFINDADFFTKSVEKRFSAIDSNHDGILSYTELACELKKLRVIETHYGIDGAIPSSDELGQLYHGLFARFDHDGNGSVDLEEYKSEMREVMLGIASGLGFLPVQMVLEEGSFLKLAVEREMAAKVYA